MDEPAQRHIRSRTSETFRAGEFYRRQSQTFDVAGMTNRAHRDPVVDLKKLLARTSAHRQEKNSIAITNRRNRTPLRELRFNVLAPVRDRFYPTIRFLDHATLCLKISPTFASASVVIPSRDTILISGKTFPLRSTPPVAVSASAAVSRARNAIATDSSSFSSWSFFPPQWFS